MVEIPIVNDTFFNVKLRKKKMQSSQDELLNLVICKNYDFFFNKNSFGKETFAFYL